MKKYLYKRLLIHTGLSLAMLCSQTAIAADPTFLFRYQAGYSQGQPPISGAPISVVPASLDNFYVGDSAFVTLRANGGNNDFSWSLIGDLPSGLSFGPGGILSGTPSEAGTFDVSFRVQDSEGRSEQYSTALRVYDPKGQAINQSVSINSSTSINLIVTGGKAPYSFNRQSGAFPNGMSLVGGSITGRPTTSGFFNAVVEAKDANKKSTTIAVSIHVSENVVAASSINDAYVGEAYSGGFTATGGDPAAYNWFLSTGALPDGLTLNATTGAISGTVSTVGSYSFTGRVTDGYSFSESSATLVAYAMPQLADKVYASPYVGSNYTEGTKPNLTGGKSPFTWSAWNLPAGLSMNSLTGVVGGTPTSSTSVTTTITVRDANNKSNSRNYTITPIAALALAAKTYPAPYVGTPYSMTDGAAPLVSGGAAPYSWTASNLPAGMIIDSSSGLISGTPTSATATTATIFVTDVNGRIASRNYAFSPKAALVLAAKTYADPYVSTAYTAAEGAAPTVSGGKSPYAWSATGLPTGMSINSGTGLISGSPTSTVATTATIVVTDANAKTASMTYAFAPRAALALAAKTYADPYLGTAYTAAEGAVPTASGGKSPYSWSASGLPAGMSINGTGLISGTATSTTSVTATITIKDANNRSTSRTYSFAPRAALVLGAKTYPDPYLSVAYTTAEGAAPTISGGLSPYTWSASNLPAGLSINSSNGLIGGTPTSATAVTATITVTDANGKTVSRTYAFAPKGALALAAKTYPDPYLGTAYTAAEGAAPAVSGGKANYSWVATGLPAGMAINASTGVISGTATATTAVTATITVTDANGKKASRSYAFSPRAVLTISNALATTMDRATAIGTTMAATGGKTSYTWSATGLPTGLSINASSGAVTGTPTANGTFSAVVKVTDANSKSVTKTTSITVTSGTYTAALTAGASAVTLRSLFTAAQWSSDIPKVVTLASGQIRGNTSSAAAVSIGGAWGGSLTFNVAGQIQGAPGAANGGAGGTAFNADVLGASSQKISLNVTGYIRGGGGGGGKGGTGGKGGNGSVNGSPTRSPASGYSYSTDISWQHPVDPGGGFAPARRIIKWNGTEIVSDTLTASSFKVGNITYYRGPNKKADLYFPAPGGVRVIGQLYDIYREQITTTNTTGGAGGAGGNGGAGVGYNAAVANGVAGVAGAAGSGTNAGKGGTGGTGGKGGGWGAAGSVGSTGATGASGTTATGTTNAGAAGSAGAAGGAAGVAINGNARVTLTGTTANVIGTRQ